MSIADWGLYTHYKDMARTAQRKLSNLRLRQTKQTKIINNIKKEQQQNKAALKAQITQEQLSYDKIMMDQMTDAMQKGNSSLYQELANEQSYKKQQATLYMSSYESYLDEVDNQYLQHFTDIGDQLEREIQEAENDVTQYNAAADSAKKSYEQSMNSIFGKNNG